MTPIRWKCYCEMNLFSWMSAVGRGPSPEESRMRVLNGTAASTLPLEVALVTVEFLGTKRRRLISGGWLWSCLSTGRP